MTKTKELDPAKIRELAVEVHQAEAIEASISSTDPDRAARIAEQFVVRAEERARAEGPRKFACQSCPATFATQDAAELHVESFHPEAPEDVDLTPVGPAPTPVTVVEGPKKRVRNRKRGVAKAQARKDEPKGEPGGPAGVETPQP